MHLSRRFVLLCLLVCFALSIQVTATPLCPTAGTYADLLATNSGGGCAIGDQVFSDFTYLPSSAGGSPLISASEFNFLTVSQAPTATGFQFGFAMSALAGQSNDIQLSWLVSGPNITSNHLAIAGTAVGNAVLSVGETYCLGGPVAGCALENSGILIVYAFGDGPAQLVDNATFAPVTKMGVFKDINVTAGPGGFATVSGVIQTVDEQGGPGVPEPGTMFVGGCGLSALAWFRRRAAL